MALLQPAAMLRGYWIQIDAGVSPQPFVDCLFPTVRVPVPRQTAPCLDFANTVIFQRRGTRTGVLALKTQFSMFPPHGPGGFTEGERPAPPRPLSFRGVEDRRQRGSATRSEDPPGLARRKSGRSNSRASPCNRNVPKSAAVIRLTVGIGMPFEENARGETSACLFRVETAIARDQHQSEYTNRFWLKHEPGYTTPRNTVVIIALIELRGCYQGCKSRSALLSPFPSFLAASAATGKRRKLIYGARSGLSAVCHGVTIAS